VAIAMAICFCYNYVSHKSVSHNILVPRIGNCNKLIINEPQTFCKGFV